MKIGDLVIPGSGCGMIGFDYKIGIIVDAYYNDDDCIEYFNVMWHHEIQWWGSHELKVFFQIDSASPTSIRW